MLNIQSIIDKINLKKKVYVAYSGGLDSSALLYLMNNLKKEFFFELEAIHVNHNLSKQSLDWENHCINFCKRLGIPLIVKNIKVKKTKGGFESNARKARYIAFKDAVKKNEQILLAHHADDVAETFLLRLFRGTGIDGLEGPVKKRKLGKGYIIRPLLDFSKQDLTKYISENKISYVDDHSNFEVTQDRNFLRNVLLPKIEERWQNVSNRINRTTNIIQTRNESYSNLLHKNYSDLIGAKIKINDLKELPQPIAVDLIRNSIKNFNIAAPSKGVMDEIYNVFILSNPTDKSEVNWSRADNDEFGGRVIFRDLSIVIKKNKL